MTALATDLAEVLNKHRPIIDHVLSTLDATAEPVESLEEKHQAMVNKQLKQWTAPDRSSNVDNN